MDDWMGYLSGALWGDSTGERLANLMDDSRDAMEDELAGDQKHG